MLGIVQVGFGGALLAWTGRHYEDLHGPLGSGNSTTHPTAVYVVGLATTVGIGAALALAVAFAFAFRG
ncbi:hypothetical protein BH23ACT3_BH23ACT3_20240 [soil metagenome]